MKNGGLKSRVSRISAAFTSFFWNGPKQQQQVDRRKTLWGLHQHEVRCGCSSGFSSALPVSGTARKRIWMMMDVNDQTTGHFP